ncbi:MAG: hypothetical protein RIS36_140 [Pseudomonadota bacterium]|jgi:hypothetical protein
MSQAQATNAGSHQSQEENVKLNLPTTQRQSCLSGLKTVVGEGAEVYVNGAKWSKVIALKVCNSIIKPHLGKWAAVATIGTSVATMGAGATALAVGGLAGAASTVVTAAALTGVLSRAVILIWGGGKAVIGKVKDVCADLNAGVKAIKMGVNVAAQETRNARITSANSRMETTKGKVEAEVRAYLDKLTDMQMDDAAREVIKAVKEGAGKIFNALNERMIEIAYQTKSSQESPKHFIKKVDNFMTYLKDELTENILGNFAHSRAQDPMSELNDRLNDLVEKAKNFTVNNAETVLILPCGSAASTNDRSSQATDESHVPAETQSKYSEFFGNGRVPDEITVALDKLTDRSTLRAKNQAVALIQSKFSGGAVTLDPKDKSVQAEVLKMASIPADREIPHFKDLYSKLKESYPDKCKLDGDKIVITGANRRSITLQNRHPSKGGKVTVSFGTRVQGGMWNDNVEAVVRAFIDERRYPTLKSASTPVTDRVVAETRSSQQEAIKLFNELRNEFGDNSFKHVGVRWQINAGKSVLYAERETRGDSRTWKIVDGNGKEMCSGIAIKDLKTEIKIARDVKTIVFKKKKDERQEFELSNGSRIVVQTVTKGMTRDSEKVGQVAVYEKVKNEKRKYEALTTPPDEKDRFHASVYRVVRNAYKRNTDKSE